MTEIDDMPTGGAGNGDFGVPMGGDTESGEPNGGSPQRRSSVFGLSMTFLCAGSLSLSLLLVAGLLGILMWYGMGHFWPSELVQIRTTDDEVFLAEKQGWREARGFSAEEGANLGEFYLKVGNRDVYPIDFRWLAEDKIAEETVPEDVAVFERFAHGVFFGRIREIRRGDEVLSSGHEASLKKLAELMPRKDEERAEIRHIEKIEAGDISYEQNELQYDRRCILQSDLPESEEKAELAKIDAEIDALQAKNEKVGERLGAKREEFEKEKIYFDLVDGRPLGKPEPVGEILSFYEPNRMGFMEKVGHYFVQVWRFLVEDPREANTEGGIFPAIFGTVLMVFLMTFVVTPFGVLAALYLREYARQGTLVGFVRIAVNNLAGVPSIVFGLFGLGFFVYLLGGTIDDVFYPCRGEGNSFFGTGGILWAALTLALLTMPVVIVATEEGLAAVPSEVRQGSLALGATKWETTWRVVIPAASPGILTGTILAIARAAGEVAPLMIVGMVKLADLPFDHHFPYMHLEAKFMHLGFHIYDLGFQSPNAEAARPLVYATALLLIILVTLMNVVAIVVRNHLRARYSTSAV